MPATTKNLTGDDRLEAGATFTRTWRFLSAPDVPHNLSGLGTWRAFFRKNYDDTETFQATIDPATDPATGVITFTVPASETEAYAQTAAAASKDGMVGVWDLESQDSSNPAIVTRWLEGTWLMSEEATYDNPS